MTEGASRARAEGRLFARITRFRGDPDRVEDGIFLLHEQVIPRARQRPGQVHGYWMVDRATGEAAVLSLWETEAAMAASEAAAEALRQA
ncbi:MAG: hypothetical protein M3295_00435, partial [Chloroflexota bacterium]|nr:hypothetical protein [Chloroflexota bacterium]